MQLRGRTQGALATWRCQARLIEQRSALLDALIVSEEEEESDDNNMRA